LRLAGLLTLLVLEAGLATEEDSCPTSAVGVGSYVEEADSTEEAASVVEDAMFVDDSESDDSSAPVAEVPVGLASAVEEEAASDGLATTVLEGAAWTELDEAAELDSAPDPEPELESLEAPGATQLDPVNPVASVGRLEA